MPALLFWLRRSITSAQLLAETDRQLQTAGLQETLVALRQQTWSTVVVIDREHHIRRQALLLRRLARVLPGNITCLRQSLVAQALLRNDGCDTAVKIGVKRTGPGSYLLHAWLEDGSVAVLEDEAALAGFRTCRVIDAAAP